MGILQHVITATEHVLRSQGTWAVFWLMILESACIPAPSEVIMLYAGYLVSKGDATLLGVIAAGVAGNVVGSWIAWAVGAYGGRPFIERHGRWIRLNHHHLDVADRFFAHYGPAAVGFTRCLPIVRTFISLPAGIARMPFLRFSIYTLLGCLPWVAFLALVGVGLGPHWEKAHAVLHYVDYLVVLAIVGGIGWWLLRRRRAGAAEPG
jgi:membrane protein DedA with SNARE-associated domain